MNKHKLTIVSMVCLMLAILTFSSVGCTALHSETYKGINDTKQLEKILCTNENKYEMSVFSEEELEAFKENNVDMPITESIDALTMFSGNGLSNIVIWYDLPDKKLCTMFYGSLVQNLKSELADEKNAETLCNTNEMYAVSNGTFVAAIIKYNDKCLALNMSDKDLYEEIIKSVN